MSRMEATASSPSRSDLWGKKVFIGEDGAEWARGKWPWYARLYLRMTRWNHGTCTQRRHIR